MNVKELILSQPAADIAAALIDRLDVEPAKRDKGIHIISITTVKIFLYILPKLGIQRGNFF